LNKGRRPSRWTRSMQCLHFSENNLDQWRLLN